MNLLHTAAKTTATKATVLFALFLLAASPGRAALDAPSAARLSGLNSTPAQAGDLVYRGATFAQKQAGPEPLFRYERRVATTPAGIEATHLTRDPAQNLVIAESAQFNTAYQLQRFTVYNQQLGYSGVVQVSGDRRHVQYRLNDNGVVSTARETINLPAVSGPTLFGFILEHSAQLDMGKTLSVRFIVMKEKQSYGLDIRQESAANGQVVYAITPSSWLVRPFLATMRATWDTGSKSWVRYEGRVPPMQTVTGKLADLDARVDYSTVSDTYR